MQARKGLGRVGVVLFVAASVAAAAPAAQAAVVTPAVRVNQVGYPAAAQSART